MLTAASFTTGKRRKQPRCPSVGDGSAEQRGYIPWKAPTHPLPPRGEPEDTALSEIREAQTDEHCTFPLR